MAKSKAKAIKTLAASKKKALPNAFEQRVTKLKHDVIGKRVKGTKGSTTSSRTRAVKARVDAFSSAIREEKKSNQFQDARATLAGDDAALYSKLARERNTGVSRSSKFNLEAGDDGQDFTLTHKGKPVSALAKDDFNEQVDASSDEEQESADWLRARFGGEGGDDNGADIDSSGRKRSHAEIMQEVIAKSKQHKVDRQKEKFESEQLLDNLDQQADDVAQLLSFRESKDSGPQIPSSVLKEYTDFDSLAAELRFENRVAAQEKLLTAEDIAKREKERLERLEAERKRRMTEDYVEEEDSDDDNGQGEETVDERRARKRVQFGGGDDLEENFVIDSDIGSGSGDDDGNEGSDGSSSDEYDSDSDDDEEDDDDSGDSDDQDQDGLGKDDLDDVAGDDINEGKGSSSKTPKAQKSALKKQKLSEEEKTVLASADAEVPFVMDVPDTAHDLVLLLKQYSASERNMRLVFQRMLSSNHISIGGDNKDKLERLAGMMLNAYDHPYATISMLNAITVGLWALAQQVPNACAQHCRDVILENAERLKAIAVQGQAIPTPTPGSLMFLSAMAGVWPTTDLRHPVVTPCMLLLDQWCSAMAVRESSAWSDNDAMTMTLLAAISVQFVKSSERMSSDLNGLLLSMLERTASVVVSSRSPEQQQWPLAPRKTTSDFEDLSVENWFSTASNSSKQLNDAQRVGLLKALVTVAAKTFSALPACDGSPCLQRQAMQALLVLKTNASKICKAKKFKSALEDAVESLDSSIKKLESLRQPLALHRAKPIAMKSFNPKFEEHFDADRDYDPDRLRAETKKLRRQHNKELKATIRESRRDNEVISELRDHELRKKDAKRDKKTKEVMRLLYDMDAEAKEAKRAKKMAKKKGAF